MQIKLIPRSPHPTILFTLTLPNPDPTTNVLPLPQAYQNLLHLLATSSPPLEAPGNMHALDRATFLVEVCAEVAFDLSASGKVRCVWVDGGVEEWPLGEGLGEDGVWRRRELLESVVRDVDLSAEELERERAKEEWDRFGRRQARDAQAQAELEAVIATAPKATTVKHKKHRSLLMSLVASLVPTSLPSLPTLPTSSPPPSPPTPLPPPAPPALPPTHATPRPTSRHLRHRARSTLIDAWRRYVVPQLRARVALPPSYLPNLPACPSAVGLGPGAGVTPPHLYIVHSMIRRVEAEMEWVVKDSFGGVLPGCLQSQPHPYSRPPRPRGFGGPFGFGGQGELAGRDVFFGEADVGVGEGGEAEAETDTDGSSVHTPSSEGGGGVAFPLTPGDYKTPESQPPPDFDLDLPRTPSPPSPPSHSPYPHTPYPLHQNSHPLNNAATVQYQHALQTYSALSTQHRRLTQQLARLHHLSSRVRAQEQAGMSVLEAKSRRRAWGNGMYLVRGGCGGDGEKGGKGVGAGLGGQYVGLGLPFRSSPLRWGCVRASEVEVEVEVAVEGDLITSEDEGVGLVPGLTPRLRIADFDMDIDTPSRPCSPLFEPPYGSRPPTRLFPLSEDESDEEDEDEEEGQGDEMGVGGGYERDLEDGLFGVGSADGDGFDFDFEGQRRPGVLDVVCPAPMARTRVRTQSIHNHHHPHEQLLLAFNESNSLGGGDNGVMDASILPAIYLPRHHHRQRPIHNPPFSLPLVLPVAQRPPLTRTSNQQTLPLLLPPPPQASESDSQFDDASGSPPPYDDLEEEARARSMRERCLFEYDHFPSASPSTTQQDDSSAESSFSSDESTLVSSCSSSAPSPSSSSSSEFTLALESRQEPSMNLDQDLEWGWR